MKEVDHIDLIVLPSGWQLCRLLALLCLLLLLCSPLLAPLEAKFHQLVWQQPVSLQLVLSSLTSNTNNVQL